MITRQWAIALACAGCLLATSSAQAQWGLNGEGADPRNDPCVCGNAAAEASTCIPGIDIWGGYLAWWLRAPNGTPQLGTIGPDSFDYGSPFSGGELRTRMWLDNTQTGSLEMGGFILAQRSFTEYGLTGATGTVESADSFLWGADANLVVNTLSPVDLIAGLRYLDLKEDLDITTATAATTNFDHFNARNQWYGGQVGAQASYRWGMFNYMIDGLLGLGDNHETLNVSGNSTTAAGTLTPGGTYATAANSGVFHQDEFAILVQTGGKIGIDLTSGVQAYIGYDFLYLNNVVRPYNQVNPAQAATLAPGAVPTVPFNSSYFWAQGVTVGLSVRY